MRQYVWVLLVLAVLLASPVSALINPDAKFGGCMIATSKGGLQDADCDNSPDPYDNCPLTSNPDQVDVDKNGIGDACDLLIEEIRIEPEQPMQGRSVIVQVALVNNRMYPMRNLVVKTEAPALGIAQSEDVDVIGPGQRVRKELVMRVPECAPARFTDFAVMAEYPFSPGQKEVFSHVVKAPVISSGLCAAETGNDKTVVNILEIQDVNPQTGALYPFTIKNTQAESKAYVLSVDQIEDWGFAEVHPGTVIVVPPGEARDGAVQVWAYPGVQGKKSFMLTIQAKDDLKQVMLLADIPVAPQPPQPSTPPFVAWLALLLVIGLIVAIIVVYMQREKRK